MSQAGGGMLHQFKDYKEKKEDKSGLGININSKNVANDSNSGCVSKAANTKP